MYICLEGIDGSGKSTQIILLEKWLEDYGFDIKRIFEPTNLPIGKLIRQMLKNPQATGDKFQKTLALLFAADRMMLIDEIEEAEAEDKIVISDRSFYSSIAYQNEQDWLYEINKYVKTPDCVILLDVDIKTAISRCDGKDSFENEVFLEKIKKKYLKLADENDFYVINGNNGINKVHDDIKKVLSPKIGRCI